MIEPSRVYSAGILGINGSMAIVSASVRPGPESLTILGKLGRALETGPRGERGTLNDAQARVKPALNHCGHPLPPGKQLVTITPEEQRRDITGSDLAIACSLLVAHGIVPPNELAVDLSGQVSSLGFGPALEKVDRSRRRGTMLWAELAYDGSLRPAVGTLIVADMARRLGFRRLIVAPESAPEAGAVPDIEIMPARNLSRLVEHLRGETELPLFTPLCKRIVKAMLAVEGHSGSDRANLSAERCPDLADIRGMTLPKKALEIMLAGGHNLLLTGSPGVGKTMLARRVRSLLPDLDDDESLEVSKLYSASRRTLSGGLIRRPPVRMPHHSVSVAGLLGGSNPPRPGEVSLAHRGVLFLDELPEFARACIEGLRQPLTEKSIVCIRARYTLDYPSDFQLLASMNPCPCGYLGHPDRACACSPGAVARYQSRIAPTLKHFDLFAPVAPISPAELELMPPGESSASVRERILRARVRQRERFADSLWKCNADIPSVGAADRFLPLTDEARDLAVKFIHSRAHGDMRQLQRIARTVEDLSPEAGDLISAQAVKVASIFMP